MTAMIGVMLVLAMMLMAVMAVIALMMAMIGLIPTLAFMMVVVGIGILHAFLFCYLKCVQTYAPIHPQRFNLLALR